MEVCGGAAETTKIAVKLGLVAGKNHDLVAGIDLNEPREQQKLYNYIRTHRPLCIVMSPTCRPFGGWSHFNRVMNPEQWQRSLDQALPHGRC
eukprot:6461287-Amphidinium_carterae.2